MILLLHKYSEKAIELDKKYFKRLCVENEPFGLHSLRKGSPTFAGSDRTIALSMAGIYNRTG